VAEFWACSIRTYVLSGPLLKHAFPAAAYSPQDLGSKRKAAARLPLHASGTQGSSAATAAHSSHTASSTAPPPGVYDCQLTRHGGAVAWSAGPGAAAAFKASARQPAQHRVPPPPLPALQQQLLDQQQEHTAPTSSAAQHGEQAEHIASFTSF
jgi:hypothetical protein